MPAVVVTGASRGIGLAVVERLLLSGHDVVAVDVDGEALTASAAHLPGPQLALVVGDAADIAVIDEACRLGAQRNGGLVGFVANAGMAQPGPSIGYSRASWDAILNLNLSAVFDGFRTAAAAMRTGGSMVATSSISALQGFGGRAAYAATKAGVNGLVRSLAVEFAPRLRVNAVAPGYVATDLVARNVASGVLDEQQLRRRIPLDRLATADEVAAAVAFLLGPDASYITGVVLPVDGGWLAYGLPLREE